MTKKILGLDIGGTGIKGAIVDVETGDLLTERLKMATPKPSNKENLSIAIKGIINELEYDGEVVGCGFPSIVRNGKILSAANIDKSWIDTNAEELFEKANPGKNFIVVNDADAAGLAEVKFGAGKEEKGVVLLITIGTGLGSALFVNGHLVPNTEFGHIYLKGDDKIAEKFASNSARKKLDLDWDEWTDRFNIYLKNIEHLVSPDLIILGGGVSKKFDQYGHLLKSRCIIKPAILKNAAGVIGAAYYAGNLKKVGQV